MRNSFDNGFIDTDDLMPDSENNKIRELSEEGKQQYLEERIRKFEIDAMQQVSFLDGINSREDENTFLEDLSREMYLVIGLHNLYHHNNDYGYSQKKYHYDYFEDESLSFDKKVSKLKALGEETDKIMDIRRIIYNELKTSSSRETIEDRNPNITCNELWPNSLEYMNSKIESIIIELSRKLLLDEKKPSGEFRDNNYLMNALRNLEESMGYARQVELDLLCKMMDSYFIFTPLKDFVTKLMHIIVDLNMNMIDDEKFTNTKTEFFETVKNYRGIPYGDKLWGLYLLSVMACDDVVEAFGGSTDANYVKNTFKEMIEHMEEILVDNQKYEYQVFDLYNYQGSYLLAQQKRNNIVSVCLYSINQIPSKRFYNINYVRKIVKVLRGSTFLRDKYTDMSIFCSKSKRSGTSCFAIMAIDDSGKKYVSISGVDIDPSSTSYLMSKLIGTSYVYVDDKEDYYLPGGYKISLKGLRDSVYLTASESKKAKTKAYKRMFSCCERKFVNYLEQGRLHELYVKYPPCYMCERMIDHEEVDKMCKIEIICPESKYYKSVVNKEYDKIAKKALNI